jgi:hypothetical protein
MFVSAAVTFLVIGALVLWLLRRRVPYAAWTVTPQGFRAESWRGYRVILGALLAAAVVLLVLSLVVGAEPTAPLGLICALLTRELIRTPAGPLTVTTTGLGIGDTVHPWADVHQAYLVDGTVEIRLTPRWITWFGDRRLYVRRRAYLVPAAEIHWLIQHYLLFPAERERMDTLPTRAYELPT